MIGTFYLKSFNFSNALKRAARCAVGSLARSGLFSLFLAMVLAGCSDDRSPFESYVACNEQIRTAENDRDLLSCFTVDKRDAILAEHADHTPEVWREQFRSWRPTDVKLFREILADQGDSANLYMYSGTGVYLAQHTARMQRISGSWRIADENTVGVSPSFNDRLDAPASVSLSFEGAVHWTGEDALTVQAPARPYCHLQIRHVFDYAMVHMQVDCEKLEVPGKYSASDIQHPEASRPIYIQAPDGGRLDRVEDGVFTVESFTEGRFSASFEFAVEGLNGPYTVSGRIENTPVIGDS